MKCKLIDISFSLTGMTRYTAIVITLSCFLSFSYGAIVFQDDFSDIARSYKNWKAISVSDGALNFQKNNLLMVNSNPTFFSLAIHHLPQPASEFTFSANITSSHTGAGLYFGFVEKDDGYYGFGALIGDQTVYVYKFEPFNSVMLAAVRTPFLKPSENRLSVSVCNDKTMLFCNGYYIKAIPNSQSTGGDVGLIVQPLTEAVFDDIVIADTVTDSMSFVPFYDNFTEVLPFGWSFDGNALVDRGNGVLNIQTNCNQQYISGIEIPVQSFQMKTVVSFERGDSNSFYGFYLKSKNRSDSSFLVFAITGNGCSAAGSIKNLIDSIAFRGERVVKKQFSSSDSLLLIIRQNTCIFEINGEPFSFQFQNELVCGAGIFVSKNLYVKYHNFCIENALPPATSILCDKKTQTLIQKPLRQNIWLDFLGRKVYTPTNTVLSVNLLINKTADRATRVLNGKKMLR